MQRKKQIILGGNSYGSLGMSQVIPYAKGGSKPQSSSTNITSFNGGGTHAENPLGGIPVGQDPETGQVQTVEEGETMAKIGNTDFIFSNRYFLSKRDLEAYNLPKNLGGLSMSEASDKVAELYKDREGAISDTTKREFLERIAEAQETQKAEEETKIQQALQMNADAGYIDPEGMSQEPMVEGEIPQQPTDMNAVVPENQGAMPPQMFFAGGEKQEGVTNGIAAASSGFSGAAGNAGGIVTGTMDLASQASGNTSPKAGVAALKGAAAGASVGTMIFPGIGCVCAGTRVMTNNGEFINIEDLTQDMGIIGYNNKSAHPQEIIGFKEPALKESVEITLNSGKKLRCSTDHPIFSANGGNSPEYYHMVEGKKTRVYHRNFEWREAGNLTIGDNVAVIAELPFFGNVKMYNPYLVGLCIGDGSYNGNRGVRLASSDIESWDYLENLGFNSKEIRKNKGQKELRQYSLKGVSINFKDLGIYNQVKTSKRLPENIHLYDKDSLSKLIAGLWDSDGHVYPKRGRLKFSQSNLTLIRQIQEVLVKFGIHSTVTTAKSKKFNDQYTSKENYQLNISDRESFINFYKNIKLNIKYKQELLDEGFKYFETTKGKDNNVKYSGVYAERVINIENIGLQYVYNLEAGGSHTYIANLIVTHNTAIGAGVGAIAGFIGGSAAKKKADRAVLNNYRKATSQYEDPAMYAKGGAKPSAQRESINPILIPNSSYAGYNGFNSVGEIQPTNLNIPTSPTYNQDTKGNVVDYSQVGNNLMRTAPVINNAAMLMSLQKPEVRVPIKDESRVARNYMNTDSAVRSINQQANRQVAAMTQAGATPAERRAMMLASQLQRNEAVGSAAMQAQNYNLQVDERAQAEERRIYSENLRRAEAAQEAYEMDKGAYETTKWNLMNTMGNSIGAMGLENQNAKRVETMSMGYDQYGNYVDKDTQMAEKTLSSAGIDMNQYFPKGGVENMTQQEKKLAIIKLQQDVNLQRAAAADPKIAEAIEIRLKALGIK